MMKIRVSIWVLVTAALALAAAGSPAPVRAVSQTLRVAPAGLETGTCSSWGAACSLQYALSSAAAGDELWLKKGVYRPTSATDRTVSFHIGAGIALYGGFAGTETAREERSWTTNVTVLSGDIDLNDVNSDGNDIAETWEDIAGMNSYHLLTLGGSPDVVTDTTVIDGLTVTAGMATGGYLNDRGGGLLCKGNHPSYPCSPTLRHITFSGNSAQFGGALFLDGTDGGESSPVITEATFRGNASSDWGGAIYSAGYNSGSESSPTYTNVTFERNESTTNAGGAVTNDGRQGESSPTFTNVTFYGNKAADEGGAMQNLGEGGVSSPILMNVTFSGNAAYIGGAIYNDGLSGGQCQPKLTNVIMWDDTAIDTGPEIDNDSATPAIDHSIIEGSFPSGSWNTSLGTNGGGNLATDPLLSVLGSYGGTTRTMRLQTGSPAIDTGTNTDCPSTDQRGLTRPFDGDSSGTATCDIGATEFRPTVTKRHRSVGADDGWVRESGENTSVGGSRNSTTTTFRLGDDATRKQYRAILSFDTTPLPDTAVIVAVKLKVKQAGITGTNPFSSLGTIRVDLRRGAFGGSTALANADFQAAAHLANATSIPNNLVSGWYTKAFASNAFAQINKAGVTQLRLRFATGDNNDSVADYLRFYSGDAGTASQPQLILEYYVP